MDASGGGLVGFRQDRITVAGGVTSPLQYHHCHHYQGQCGVTLFGFLQHSNVQDLLSYIVFKFYNQSAPARRHTKGACTPDALPVVLW